MLIKYMYLGPHLKVNCKIQGRFEEGLERYGAKNPFMRMLYMGWAPGEIVVATDAARDAVPP